VCILPKGSGKRWDERKASRSRQQRNKTTSTSAAPQQLYGGLLRSRGLTAVSSSLLRQESIVNKCAKPSFITNKRRVEERHSKRGKTNNTNTKTSKKATRDEDRTQQRQEQQQKQKERKANHNPEKWTLGLLKKIFIGDYHQPDLTSKSPHSQRHERTYSTSDQEESIAQRRQREQLT